MVSIFKTMGFQQNFRLPEGRKILQPLVPIISGWVRVHFFEIQVAAANGLECWRKHSTEKTVPNDHAPATVPAEISLFSAKNKFETFQLIRWNQRAPRNVSWPFNMNGAAHAAFVIQNFPVERSRILPLTAPSAHRKSRRGTGDGDFYDPLNQDIYATSIYTKYSKELNNLENSLTREKIRLHRARTKNI